MLPDMILDGQYYWPKIIMDDSPDPVDEDLGINSRCKPGLDLLEPLEEDHTDSASSGSSDDVVVPT